MKSHRRERWVEFSLEQVLKHFAKTGILLETGETLVDQTAYVDVSKGFVAFKLETDVAPVMPDHDAPRVHECPLCKKMPRLLTTHPQSPHSELHRFECDKCELTTGEFDSIEQATQTWNSVVSDCI